MALLSVIFIQTASADDLADLVPTSTSVKEIKASVSLRRAVGEELFEVINGGAVLYFKHQFKKALFQEYATTDGWPVNLEIYQMGTPANAKAVFQLKRGKQGEPLSIGEEAILVDYYLLLRQGPYFISITGDEATAQVRQTLVAIARAIEQNINHLSGPR